jgi:hypothetical protein
VARALREEGDRTSSEHLLRDGGGATHGGAIVGDGSSYSADAMQAVQAGDWDRFLALADIFLNTPTAQWNLQIQGVRGWMRALRGDPAGAGKDIDEALRTARASGFWQLQWTAQAHGALGHTLLGRPDEASQLLHQLAGGWRRMRTIASGEWVAAAGHAAVRLGPDIADMLYDALADTPHHTAWSRAAVSSAQGVLAYARGDHAGAIAAHLDAAERYAAAGSATDRFLALSGALPTLATDMRGSDLPGPDQRGSDQRGSAGRPDARVAAAQAELAAFAARNHIVTTR